MVADGQETAVRQAFAKQAEWCRLLGSPFTALLCDTVGERLDRSTSIGRRLLNWPGQPDSLADALPLRLTGSLQALVRRGDTPELAAVYPPNAMPDAAKLWPLVENAFRDHKAELMSRLDLAPQTNEVGRSGPLMAGLLVIAEQMGRPFSLYELGSSAGLNLNLDRFAYNLGGLETGMADSAVRLAPRWEGSPPPQADVRVIARQGVDLSPLSVVNPDHRELLAAYIWPDQKERLTRILAAIEIARADPPRLDRMDAAAWLEKVLSTAPEPGVTRVVMHTIAFQYFPADTQARIREHIRRVGEQATSDAPFAWLRLETDPEFDNQASLRLSLWPDGGERVLGAGHPHGSSFRFF